MVFLSLPQITRQWGGICDSSPGNVVAPSQPCIPWPTMEVRLTLQEMAGNGFPRVSRHGHRGDQAGNGRKWSKMGCRGYLVGNGFPRVSRRGHRGRKKEVR